jgi:glutamate dehydrogenase (NAD(P)+)
MEDVFRFADALGPAKIVHVYEPTIGLKGTLVVDNVAVGPSIGGLRMAPDVSTEECFRLARAMTLKNAAAGLSHGGGKSVLYGDPKMPRSEKERLVRAMACALRGCDDYIFGPDMGTDEGCMAWVKEEIGRAVGLPRELGGIPLDELGATGWGLLYAAEASLEHVDFELEGARVVVQGFGSVGMHAARFLVERGAVLVGASDSRGSTCNPKGLDVGTLMELKRAGKSVMEHPDAEARARDAVIDLECEIWIPAARPDVIHEGNVDRLNTRLILQGANIPLTPASERVLHERGVLSIPDFIANAGGVICAAMEYRGANQADAFQSIAEKVRSNTAEVLARSRTDGLPPRDAAVEMSVQRVRQAMSYRRWSIF